MRLGQRQHQLIISCGQSTRRYYSESDSSKRNGNAEDRCPLFQGARVKTPPGAMDKCTKLLADCWLRFVINRVPSCLNTSTRILTGNAVVFIATISDAQPPS